MQKALKKRIESALEQHGRYAVREAVRSAAKGNREALRALELGDCYRLELRQIMELLDGRQSYDPAAELRAMLG